MTKAHDDTDPTQEPARAERIHSLRRAIERATGEPLIEGASANCPPDLQEKFLESVLRYETAQETTIGVLLLERGYHFPPPEAIADAALPRVLDELIQALAGVRVFLDFTDHLSDRELYDYLWHEALPTRDVLFPDDPNFACHLDPIGSGSHEDVQIYLKYYAEDSYRAHWEKEFPDDPMPSPEEPPYDRDQHLPLPY